MLLRKSIRTSCVNRPFKKLTYICMSLKTWLRPWNPKCSCAMLPMSNKHRRVSEIGKKQSKRKSKSTGRKLKNRRCQSTMRKWRRSLNRNTTSDKKTLRTLVNNSRISSWITLNKSKRNCWRENSSRDKSKKTFRGRNRKKLQDRRRQRKSELSYLKQTKINSNKSRLHCSKRPKMRKRSNNLLDRGMLVMRWKRSAKINDSKPNKKKDSAWLTVRSKNLGSFRITKKKFWIDR